MSNEIRIPLDLPDVRILEVSKTDRGHWLIRLESTLKGTTCKKCGREISDYHGLDQTIRLRHLPLFDVPVFIELRPKRYRCRFCQGNPTTTQRLEWYEPRSPNTKPYEQWLLRLLINSTVSDVARKLGLTDELVEGVLDRWIAREVDGEEFERLGGIGIDEIALKRGHRDFVVLVTAPLVSGGIEVLAGLPDRTKETVLAFFESIPEALRGTITRGCTDRYRGFVEAAREAQARDAAAQEGAHRGGVRAGQGSDVALPQTS
jgi:transposase